MGANRPTMIVQRYQEIYSQERIEAYDAIIDIELVDESRFFISGFLLDILKVSLTILSLHHPIIKIVFLYCCKMSFRLTTQRLEKSIKRKRWI